MLSALLAPLRFLFRALAMRVSLPLLRFTAFAVTWIASGLAVACLGGVVAFFMIASTVPDPSPLYRYRPVVATEVTDQSGNAMFRLSREYRLFVPYEDLPDHLIYAFLVAEDQRFFEHGGVDGISLLRAAFANIKRSYQKQRALGGSTITQQVAKMYVGADRTFMRKLREAILAAKLEQRLEKSQILEIYLNEVFFGVNTYGVGAATERYFGKSIKDLDLSEAAFLAALPKGPNNYHPLRHPEAAKERRDWVLARMAEAGIISQLDAQYAVAQSLPQTIHYGLRGSPSSYFDLEVQRELEQRFGEAAIYSQGLQARSSLDPDLQQLAEMTLQEHILTLDVKEGFRGPIQRLNLHEKGWDRAFLDLQLAQVFPGWRPALIIQTSGAQARLLFKTGQEGRMRLEDMAWARPYRFGQGPGPYPERVDQVLFPGDVVWVEALAERPAELPGTGPGKDQGEEPALPGNAASLLNAAYVEVSAQMNASANADATPRDNGEAPAESTSLGLPRYRLRQLPLLSGAALVMDTQTAQIKALVGGVSPKLSHFNRATQALRQPGSTIKPFVALAALSNGLSPNTKLADQKLTIRSPGAPDWSPQNYDRKFWGNISLSKALTYSRNVPMVRLYQKLGLGPINQTLQALRLYDAPLSNPSVVLGANETSLMRLAAAYAAIANHGVYRQPTTLAHVEGSDGVLLFSAQQESREQCLMSAFCQLLDGEAAVSQQAAKDLQGMLRQVMVQGTGRSTQAKVPYPLMGKTGTSNAARDAWFIGFDEHTLIAVFVGYDTPESLGKRATGGGIAGPIFADLFNGMRDWQNGQLSIAMKARGFRVGRSFDREAERGLAALGIAQDGHKTKRTAAAERKRAPQKPQQPQQPTTTNPTPVNTPSVGNHPSGLNSGLVSGLSPQTADPASNTLLPGAGFGGATNSGQAYINPGYAGQGFANQGFANQGYVNQGFTNQGYANQGVFASPPPVPQVYYPAPAPAPVLVPQPYYGQPVLVPLTR